MPRGRNATRGARVPLLSAGVPQLRLRAVIASTQSWMRTIIASTQSWMRTVSRSVLPRSTLYARYRRTAIASTRSWMRTISPSSPRLSSTLRQPKSHVPSGHAAASAMASARAPFRLLQRPRRSTCTRPHRRRSNYPQALRCRGVADVTHRHARHRPPPRRRARARHRGPALLLHPSQPLLPSRPLQASPSTPSSSASSRTRPLIRGISFGRRAVRSQPPRGR